jgi:hypothetical protein
MTAQSLEYPPYFFSVTHLQDSAVGSNCNNLPGMNFPLFWRALFTALSMPPQQGTSMRAR